MELMGVNILIIKETERGKKELSHLPHHPISVVGVDVSVCEKNWLVLTLMNVLDQLCHLADLSFHICTMQGGNSRLLFCLVPLCVPKLVPEAD